MTLALFVQGQEHTAIFEHHLYEGLSQGQNTFTYFKVILGQMYYTGTEHLIVKVLADSFESDPDVYISRSNPGSNVVVDQYPTDSTNSNWHCEREGSETCVLHNGQYAVGDTLYLGIKCVKECQYKLKL